MIKRFESFEGEWNRICESNRMIDYYPNKQKKYEIWFLNNRRHRENGPAFQSWYENGQNFLVFWYLNGKFHRENGPAYEEWYENGQKKRENWYLNDKEYSREKWIDELKKIKSKHYKEQKMLFDIEKYNL